MHWILNIINVASRYDNTKALHQGSRQLNGQTIQTYKVWRGGVYVGFFGVWCEQSNFNNKIVELA